MLSDFAELLWDEQKPGLHVCCFLCTLLAKLMIVGLPHSVTAQPIVLKRLLPGQLPQRPVVSTKEAGSLWSRCWLFKNEAPFYAWSW